MSKVYKSVEELIGHTPMVELKKIEKQYHTKARIMAKLEMFNPAGSAKDRVAKAMLDDAEAKGLLAPGSVIIEPTSGNTGIGLAAVGTARGYRVIIVMPDSMSKERCLLMTAYGAELVLTPGALGMQGAIDKAEELKASIPGSIIAGQFYNPANPAIHRVTTGPEIWDDLDGKVHMFIAGVGTGGTVSGVGEFLKSRSKSIKVIGVEPAESPVISQGKAGTHGIQGIGANFVPENFNSSVVDEIMTVKTEDAYAFGRELAKLEGLLVGISSGAALAAAVVQAQKQENAGKTIVALLPDTGERYLTTPMFESES